MMRCRASGDIVRPMPVLFPPKQLDSAKLLHYVRNSSQRNPANGLHLAILSLIRLMQSAPTPVPDYLYLSQGEGHGCLRGVGTWAAHLK